MNHYKYIALGIQDLSTGELVHSAVGEEDLESVMVLSKAPVEIFVRSDNFEELFRWKKVIENMCNSIYEVNVLEDDDITMKLSPAYLDNLIYYNTKIACGVLGGKKAYTCVKPLPANRFQVIERFTSDQPRRIQFLDGYCNNDLEWSYDPNE
jgi:hypothetical protein